MDDPLDAAVVSDDGAAGQAGMDPLAIVEAAVEDGTAAPEREKVDTPPEIEDLVRSWWERTADGKDFIAAVDQTDDDRETLEGGTEEEVADQAEVTVNHVYRNAIATVAITVPNLQEVNWQPREQVEPLAGMMVPPEYEKTRRARLGLSAVMGVLFRRFGADSNLEEKAEAFVQDATHFRMAVMKCWFQRDLEGDPISDERLPDEQDLMARARVLIEQYDRGEFTKSDAKYAEMGMALAAVGKTEVAIRRSVVMEQVPLQQYRCDPSVNGPEHIRSAEWEAQDVLLRRDNVLAKWPQIDPDDLRVCTTWTLDEVGRAVKAKQEEITTTSRDGAMAIGPMANQPTQNDWLLVREIYDYVHNTRLTLIEGLKYPAVKEPIERGPTGLSPFVVLVMNRRSGKLYGFSDTELQGKLQRAINRLGTQEEDARLNAQPRWAYDPAVVSDDKAIIRISRAEPWTFTPVATTKGNLKDGIIPLSGNHEVNPAEYDPTRLEQRMRAMAMLPEQMLGVTGTADFAAEVNSAMAGANAMARYRQKRIVRALKQLYDKFAQLVLHNVPQELAVRWAGPLAAQFFPAQPMDRQQIYEGLDIVVNVQPDQQLDYARKSDSLVKLLDSLGKMGQRANPLLAGRLLGKFLGMEDEAKDLFEPNPNDLVGLLGQVLQQQPGALAPEGMMALVQMGQAAQQQLMAAVQQQMAQAQAQQAGGPGSAGPGAPPSGLPMGGASPPVNDQPIPSGAPPPQPMG